MQNTTSFDNLPLEIQQLVLSFLSPSDLVRCMQVCSHWKDAVEDYGFWKRQFPVYDAIIERYIKEADVLDRKASASKQHDDLTNGSEFQQLYSLLIRVIKVKSFISELDTMKSHQRKEHQDNHIRWDIQTKRLESEINSQRAKLNKITYGAFCITLPFVLIALWMFSPTFSRIFWLISSLYQITSSLLGFFIPHTLFVALDRVIYGLFVGALLIVVVTYYASMCYACYKIMPLAKRVWQAIITFFLGRTLQRLEREKKTLFQRVSAEKNQFLSQTAKNQQREERLKQLQWRTEAELDHAILAASKAVEKARNNTYRPSKTNQKPKGKSNCIVM